ncbi:hypothetical protein AJ79_05098 [Helicocarpus griseus UAMH5409]|uniref:Uncharacterized protein n=1 Tax=Helicocarpus griseus UAMH5409 TaxID=1447875 RepID=A0A2B7XPH1_9EURO|nr:hypothetical protein AJ79_05098 [Helicocarpus griseus UAMH5409]
MLHGKQGAFALYKNSSTSGYEFLIPVGDADEQGLQWWAAVLAKGRGWRATLAQADRDLDYRPPSSMQAWNYLLRLAQTHSAVDQLVGAFTATLTIPIYQRFGAAVTFPQPHLGTGPSRKIEPSYLSKVPSFDELPYFMTLACIPRAISSSLFGTFWEPGVPCKLVSEWLYTPLQNVLQPLVDQEKWHVIVQIMAARRPNLAPLWLGSAITGLLPRLLKVCMNSIPPVSLEAIVWTQSPQSFMDPTFRPKTNAYRSFRLEQVIRREDEYRLLYMTGCNSDEYGAAPLCPYSPFGLVTLQGTALNVRLHSSCGHNLSYNHWMWQGQWKDGTRYLEDYGFTVSPSSVEQL